ncbi:MAG: hypothetical protein OEU46_10465 [Alphaproteobacteria bacterium]|nr:hypothetical protein [Alphaproteobacteria bacterium]
MKSYALLCWFLLITAAGYAMFHVSFQVEELEQELSDLNRTALNEQEAIHVLRAEWSYLSRPDRISELAKELLPSLRPPAVSQIQTVEQLPEKGADSVIPAAMRSEFRLWKKINN